jgi:hypothetical protein
MAFTSDPNTWVVAALIFLLGLLVGMWMTAGGRRKWKSRYKEEAARCEGLKAERDRVEQDLAEREKDWRERDSLRGAAVRDRRSDRVDSDADGVPDRADDRPLDDRKA